MQQITSYQQVQDLKVGSILIQRAKESPVRFSVQSCTPIGWEDIEFELLPVEDISGRVLKNNPSGAINMLGSEFVSDHLWWLPL